MALGNRGGGRPRKPTALHVLDGTYQPVRHASRKEPAYPEGLPPPPKVLDAVARRRYREVGTMMVKARVLTKADAGLLALYADSWSNWETATVEARRDLALQAAIEERWASIPDMDDAQASLEERIRKLERRALSESPAVKRARDEKLLLERLGSQLGLSPVQRSKAQPISEPEKKPEGMAEFLA